MDKDFEHIEHSIKLYTNLYLNTGNSKIPVDFHKLYDALFFFYDQHLQHIETKNIPPIEIILDPKAASNSSEDLQMNCSGWFSLKTGDSRVVEILISTRYILIPGGAGEIRDEKRSLDSPLEALFTTILHETYHLVSFLTNYSDINRKRKITMEDYFKEIYGKKMKFADRISQKYKFIYGEKIALMYHKSEIEAARFAYSNLSYFENLYNKSCQFYTSFTKCVND